MSVRLTILLSLLAAAPAAAQTGADGPAAATPPAAEKQICRREVVTGSIIPGKKQCHTKAEWKQIEIANQKAMDDYHNRSESGRGTEN